MATIKQYTVVSTSSTHTITLQAEGYCIRDSGILEFYSTVEYDRVYHASFACGTWSLVSEVAVTFKAPAEPTVTTTGA